MRTNGSVATILVLLLLAAPAHAHRLDEYLQAATISLEKDRVSALLRLTPGVQVFPAVMAGMDTDHDGVLSPAEQQAYARRVLYDLSLTLDGTRLQPRLISADFPDIEQMKQGMGEIVLVFEAELPSGGSNRKLRIENHHQPAISVYLMNCLVPGDPDIRVTLQTRNYEQSVYQIDYTQPADRPMPPLSLRPRRFPPIAVGGALLVISLLALLWRRRSRDESDTFAHNVSTEARHG